MFKCKICALAVGLSHCTISVTNVVAVIVIVRVLDFALMAGADGGCGRVVVLVVVVLLVAIMVLIAMVVAPRWRIFT